MGSINTSLRWLRTVYERDGVSLLRFGLLPQTESLCSTFGSLAPRGQSSTRSVVAAQARTFLGLFENEARARLLAEGSNELPQEKKRTWLTLLIEIAREPMIFLLLGTATLYFVLLQDASAMAANGLRVLGVASARAEREQLPESQREFTYRFLGLVGFADPVRPEVPEAIAECKAAGVNVIMITGDYSETALAIGSRIGLNAQSVIKGSDIERMTDDELRARFPGTSIVARAIPHHKLRIVRALKENGHVVAMTGDGVNDAPALKAAHIGVAMGGRGTDVAREAAGVVLTDDNFAS